MLSILAFFRYYIKVLVFKFYIMKCICHECKNSISLAKYPSLAVKHVIECEHCGIVLEVVKIDEGVVQTEIVDEGK